MVVAAPTLLLAAALSAGQAPDPAASCIFSTTRTGLPVVVVSSPGTPWAVVQLHAKISADGITQDLRRNAEALAFSLAEGRVDQRPGEAANVAAVGGETRALVTEDSIVISDGLPADKLSVSLAAMAQRLAKRRRLLPSSSLVLPLEGPARPPVVAREGIYARPVTRPLGEVDAAGVAALADVALKRSSAVLVVIGREPPDKLKALVERYALLTLPSGAPARVTPPVVERARVVDEVESERPTVRGAFSWLHWQTPGLATATGEGYEVLAELVGAEAGEAEGAGWFSWHVPIGDVGKRSLEEEKRIARLQALGSAPFDEGAVARAKSAVIRRRLRELAAPESLARFLGGRALAGRQCTHVAELEAVRAVSSSSLAALARALASAPHVTLRGRGRPLADEGGGS